eukprot:17162-Lingulodinium_polyedra.AAC.1
MASKQHPTTPREWRPHSARAVGIARYGVALREMFLELRGAAWRGVALQLSSTEAAPREQRPSNSSCTRALPKQHPSSTRAAS